MLDSVLLAKVLTSGGVVLGLSVLAERVGPRAAGVLSGAPLGAVMVYFFLGHEVGTGSVVAGIPNAVAGLTGTLGFVYAYYQTSLWSSRFQIPAAPLLGVATFFAIILVLSRMALDLVSALALTATATALSARLFKSKIENLRISERIRMTPRVVTFRVGLSTAFVVSIIEFAKVLGPSWAGLLIGFPMTLLPLLLIVHMTYSREHTHALIRNFPIGIIGLMIYLLTIPLTFPALGVTLGTTVSLCAAFLYLIALPFAWKALEGRKSKVPE